MLGLPDDDKSDDIFDFYRYDNKYGWLPVKKDLGYIWGHIIGTLVPVIILGYTLWMLLL
tara:strand:- start:520 stop:696 length:177 start_codon:yes stop_codon:yes gene_type:complete